jgi:hypothetical protein
VQFTKYINFLSKIRKKLSDFILNENLSKKCFIVEKTKHLFKWYENIIRTCLDTYSILFWLKLLLSQ